MQSKEHWESAYSRKAVDAVSWYQPHARLSLELIGQTGIGPGGSIIDVGGGASTLVDDLLAKGFTDITVLDLSEAALAAARSRVGNKGPTVQWMVANITQVDLPPLAYDIWHDRAVFHFLVASEDRRAYVRRVLQSLKPGGHVIIATFAEDGPLQCSGLPVMRYSAQQLHAEFGEEFTLVGHRRELHQTPFNTTQWFTYCHFTTAASQRGA